MKEPKILLIGADCTGKTALAQALSKHYGVWVQPNRRIKDPEEALVKVRQFCDTDLRGPSGFILDQWQYPVDVVYNRVLGKAHGNEPSVFESVGYEFRDALQENDVIILFLWAHSGEIVKRFNKRGDELWNIEQILEVNRAYAPTLQSLHLYYHFIDTTPKTKEQVFNEAVSIIDKRLKGDLKWDPKLYSSLEG